MSGLERRTPLAAGKPLARKRAMPRSSRNIPARRPARRREQPPRPATTSGPSADTRALIRGRDRGRCVRCGDTATNVHHRRNRGMGGRRHAASAAINQPGNLLSLCGSGTTGCHGWVTGHPAEARELGYALRTNGTEDPTTVPVQAHDGWHLYDDAGGRRRCPPPEGATP